MAAGSTPLEGSWQGRSAAWPLLVEAALVAAVIGGLLPLFATLAPDDSGRDRRFAAPAVAPRGLPAPVLPELCATYGRMAEPAVHERLCGTPQSSAAGARAERPPAVLIVALARAEQAVLAPIAEARSRIARLREQPRDGALDLTGTDRAIDDALTEIAPSLRRYVLDGDPAEAARPIACASEWLPHAFAGSAKATAASRDTLRANAVLLLGAALDAHAAMPGILGVAALPGGYVPSSRCTGIDARQGLAGTASLMADARSARARSAKDDAMRDLLRTARWQWAAWAVLGLLLLDVQRSRVSPAAGVGVALAAWAAAAWVCRVPWPLGSGHAFVLARPTESFTAMPAAFVVAMLAISVCLFAVAPWLRRAVAGARSAPASVLAYPGLVAATGIGWLALLDLSANGNFGNRYLALYHQGHLWLGMLTFSVVAFLRRPVASALAWTLSLVDGLASRVRQRVGAVGGAALLLPLTLLVTAVVASILANMRQLTSELGRLWLVLGAAWFFFLRGTPLTERLARSGNSLASLARYTWPLLFVVVVLIAAMFMTHDMGPLLIAGYGAGAFVAASVAMWLHQRRGATVSAYAIAVALFAAWIAVTTLALFRLGSIDQVTAERLENAGAPFVSVNDQLALVTWFQRAAPPAGFGPGAVPWCGFGASGTCAGVPAQIQSDYTFTALVGLFGWTTAWAITLGCALWLYATVRPHGRASRGEPRLVRYAGRIRNDEQAFLSWVCVAWLVMALTQLAVTVAGNLAVIPLTGVTFPFVSFGMTLLVVNMAMLALAINVGCPEPPV